MNINDIQELAKKHGLMLLESMEFNEMGIDFKVGFATDLDGNPWLLRIPRRTGLGEQIAMEKRILELVGSHLSVQVPDWKIATDTLVAYPLLEGKPALTFDALNNGIHWNMDKDSPKYIPSLAKVLVELHGVPKDEVLQNGLKVVGPEHLRTELSDRLQLVKSELGMGQAMEKRYKKWLDNDPLWPNYTKFIHGDLYAGHVITHHNGAVCGIIDWSTAHIDDIAQDFSGHYSVFGAESLQALIGEYQKQGGEIWDMLYEQAVERAAAAPLAYGWFALESKDQGHRAAAKVQLGAN